MFVNIISFQNRQNLSIVQLATAFQDTCQYISLSMAIKENLIEVTEVSDAGSVNSLLVLNKSEFVVFIMDGDILTGAKQNRLVNTSILLAPMSKTIIPVSCVEQGRWMHSSIRFSDTPYSAPSVMRADKARRVKESLDQKRGYTSNQGEVWDNVALFQRVADVRSSTYNLSDVYDDKAGELEEFIMHFTADNNANGLSVFLDHNLLSLDMFNRKDIYLEYFPKILRGVALEAFYMSKTKEAMQKAEAKFRTLDFLDKSDTLAFTDHPGVGIGSERRFNSDEMTGFELRHQEQMIHWTALRTGKSRTSAA